MKKISAARVIFRDNRLFGPFYGFWATKCQIDAIIDFCVMINTLILHTIVNFGSSKSGIVDIRPKNIYFRGFQRLLEITNQK